MTILGRREPLGRPAVTFNYSVGLLGLAALGAATVLGLGEGPGEPPPPASLELHAAFLAALCVVESRKCPSISSTSTP